MQKVKNVFLSMALFSLLLTNSQVSACYESGCYDCDQDQYDEEWYFNENWFDYDWRHDIDEGWSYEEEESYVEEVVVSDCDDKCGCDDEHIVFAPTCERFGDFYAYRQGNGASRINLHRWDSTDDMTEYIPEGATIRVEGGVDVYIVKYINGKMFKRLVLSPSVFENYGHLRWEDVMNVSPDILDAYTTSDLVRSEETGSVYRLYPSGDCGLKRLVKVSGCYWRQIDQDSIYLINGFDERSYTTSSVLE